MQGNGSAAQGEISFVSWNSKVQHILASTSYNGTTGEKRKRHLIYMFSEIFFLGLGIFNLCVCVYLFSQWFGT